MYSSNIKSHKALIETGRFSSICYCLLPLVRKPLEAELIIPKAGWKLLTDIYVPKVPCLPCPEIVSEYNSSTQIKTCLSCSQGAPPM